MGILYGPEKVCLTVERKPNITDCFRFNIFRIVFIVQSLDGQATKSLRNLSQRLQFIVYFPFFKVFK